MIQIKNTYLCSYRQKITYYNPIRCCYMPQSAQNPIHSRFLLWPTSKKKHKTSEIVLLNIASYPEDSPNILGRVPPGRIHVLLDHDHATDQVIASAVEFEQEQYKAEREEQGNEEVFQQGTCGGHREC